MLELTTLSGKNIDLIDNAVTIELSNSLFNDGSKFNGSTSYPLKVAFTDNNKAILEYANAVETGTKNHKIPVHAKIGGQSFRNCVLAITVAEKSFDTNLQIDLGEINEFIAKTSLKSIKFPLHSLGDQYYQIQDNMYAAAANLSWRDIPYTFVPIRNNKFTGESSVKPTLYPLANNDYLQPTLPPVPYAKKYTLLNSLYKDGAALKFNVQTSFEPDGIYHTIPYFYLAYVLDGIATELGFKLKGDFILHPDIERVIIYNNNDVFITRFNNPGYAVEEKKGIVFSANEHLPDITISEFFKSLCAYFCIRISVNSKGELNFSFKKSCFESPKYKDWKKKLVKITKQESEISGGFVLSAETDPLESDKTPILDTITVGQGQEKIQIKAGAMRTVTENFPGTEASWTIPMDIRAGNIVDPIFVDIENYRSGGNLENFPLRFLIAKGMVANGNNSFSYPSAGTNGTELNLELKNIYPQLMKPWLERTFGAKKVKALFLLSPEDICTLKDDDIILLDGENSTTVQCLFENITFSSTAENEVKAEADLIVLDSANIDNSATGVYVRLTEVNPVTTNFSQSKEGWGNNVLRTLRIKEDKTVVDLKIELFSDKFGTVPLSKKVPVFIDVKIVDNRTTNYLHFLVIQSSTPGATEFQETRRVIMENPTVVIPGVLKKVDSLWWLTTGTSYSDDVFIKRDYSFKIQPSPLYTILQ